MPLTQLSASEQAGTHDQFSGYGFVNLSVYRQRPTHGITACSTALALAHLGLEPFLKWFIADPDFVGQKRVFGELRQADGSLL